jgi:hypothetical protein
MVRLYALLDHHMSTLCDSIGLREFCSLNMSGYRQTALSSGSRQKTGGLDVIENSSLASWGFTCLGQEKEITLPTPHPLRTHDNISGHVDNPNTREGWWHALIYVLINGMLKWGQSLMFIVRFNKDGRTKTMLLHICHVCGSRYFEAEISNMYQVRVLEQLPSCKFTSAVAKTAFQTVQTWYTVILK